MIIQHKLLLFLFDKWAVDNKISIDTFLVDNGISQADIDKLTTQLNNTGLIVATLEGDNRYHARLTKLGLGYVEKSILPHLPTETKKSTFTPTPEQKEKVIRKIAAALKRKKILDLERWFHQDTNLDAISKMDENKDN